jgi:hypothetical protein
MHAALSAVLGLKVHFGITEKGKSKAISYIKLWPQLTLLFLSFVSVIWGLNRFIYEREVAILVNGFWVTYNCLIISSIFYFNRDVK